jgi:hypothetical protein
VVKLKANCGVGWVQGFPFSKRAGRYGSPTCRAAWLPYVPARDGVLAGQRGGVGGGMASTAG